MRVLIDCDPPILTEVVSLALSRIEGIEITRPEDRAEDVLVASTSTDWQDRGSPKTILLDQASTLPALVETLKAWVSGVEGEDYTLFQASSSQHNSRTPMKRTAGKAKARSSRTPELIPNSVIEGTQGDDLGGRGS